MQDRISENPGRVLITPENGPAYYATVTRADNPTQNGTPLNKASLLKDATAALFGLSSDAVPNDVLNLLSRFQRGLGNEYVWEKRGTYLGYKVAQSSSTTQINLTGSNGYFDVYARADALNGVVVLSEPVSRYWDGGLVGYYAYSNGQAYLIDSINGAGSTYAQCISYLLTAEETTLTGFAGYVNSPFEDAYPPSEDDGNVYVALGQLGNKPQIATGSYTGTGMCGINNPNILTFDFKPKIVMLFDDLGKLANEYGITSNAQACVGFCDVLTAEYTTPNANPVFWGGIATSGSYTARTQYKISLDKKTISWTNRGKEVTYANFPDSKAAAAQYNTSGKKYYYVAIG